MSLTLDDFNYHLPDTLIAQHPSAERGESRLLKVAKASDAADLTALSDHRFPEVLNWMTPADLLVFNDTKVIRARLQAQKATGGAVEIMIERVLDAHTVLAMIRASHAPKPGSALRVANAFDAQVIERKGMMYTLKMSDGEDTPVLELIERYGALPLPPYITHAPTEQDEQRYQTVFAAKPGAVAAPTAGLHFTQALLDEMAGRGIPNCSVTLHVGAGTFQPVKVHNIAEHTMHSEQYSIGFATAQAVRACRQRGGRVIAVGTTSMRALESWALNDAALQGDTDIFITPGYRFQVVDVLITNFHLPKSTLLMLVSAFAGMKTIRDAYAHAIAHEYRFFSYGDAMWLERDERA